MILYQNSQTDLFGSLFFVIGQVLNLFRKSLISRATNPVNQRNANACVVNIIIHYFFLGGVLHWLRLLWLWC